VAVTADAQGRVTLFIADYYNAVVRVVGPDGIMRRMESNGREQFGAPSRVAVSPGREWLYVVDSSEGRIVALAVPAPTSSESADVVTDAGTAPR